MEFSLKIQECEDCQRVLKRNGYENVSECKDCGHLYIIGEECSCKGWSKMVLQFSLDSLLIAFELGYIAHEKGDNLEKGKYDFLKELSGGFKNANRKRKK